MLWWETRVFFISTIAVFLNFDDGLQVGFEPLVELVANSLALVLVGLPLSLGQLLPNIAQTFGNFLVVELRVIVYNRVSLLTHEYKESWHFFLVSAPFLLFNRFLMVKLILELLVEFTQSWDALFIGLSSLLSVCYWWSWKGTFWGLFSEDLRLELHRIVIRGGDVRSCELTLILLPFLYLTWSNRNSFSSGVIFVLIHDIFKSLFEFFAPAIHLHSWKVTKVSSSIDDSQYLL